MTRTPLKGGAALCLALFLPVMAGAQDHATSPASQTAAAPAIVSTSRGVLSLRQAIELALAHNPELAVATLEVEARDGLRQQAANYPNPEISWLQEDTRQDTRTTTVQLSQTIELGGKRAARMAAADRAHDIAAEERSARRLAIGATVTAGFFDALIAQERIRIADDALELARRGTRATEVRVKSGKVAPVEETRARVAEAGVRVEAAQARGELAGARARLAALLGQSQLADRTLDAQLDDLPAAPTADETRARVEEAPALRRARLEIDHRVALTEVEKARRIPDLTVSLGAKRSEELGLNQAVVGVAVPLPLFDRNQGNLVDALKREDKAREELSAVRLQVSAEAIQARERLIAARGETEVLASEVLPGAQTAWEAASKGFELGKFSFLEALDAQRTLLQARTQHLRAMAETYRARAELDRILGLEGPSGALVAPVTR